MPRACLVLAVAFLGLPACMHVEEVEHARRPDPDLASAQEPITTARGAGDPLDIGPPAAPIENAALPPPIAYRAGDDIVISAGRREGVASAPNRVRAEAPSEPLEGPIPLRGSEPGAALLGAAGAAPSTGSRSGAGDNTVISVVRGEDAAGSASQMVADAPAEQLEGGPPTQASDSPANLR